MPAKTPAARYAECATSSAHGCPDVITTHYPDADHQVLLNVAFPPRRTRIAQDPDPTSRPDTRALPETGHAPDPGRTRRPEDRPSDRAVRQLLAHTSPAYLLSAVGHAFTQLPESAT